MGTIIIPVLIAFIAAASLLLILLFVRSPGKKVADNIGENMTKKSRSVIMKEAEKKLSRDPHNVVALNTLGGLYYGEKNWEKSWNIYKTLYEISAAHVEVDIVQACLRMGIAAYHLEKLDDASRALMIAAKKDSQNFEIMYYLGMALYKTEVFDKAIYCLKRAHELNPSSTAINEPLGMCYFRATKYRESLPFLKRVLDLQPDNKEAMFNLSVAMTETGMGDKALKIFMHLRPDPEYGARSCLEAGRIHEKTKDYEKAIQDYEIGMKLANVPEKELLMIKYRCANAYIAQKNIPKGLVLLKQISNVHPGYKDVDQLVLRYTELNQNSNLQTYLLSGTSEFVALCRKFIQVFYPKAFVKVEDVSVQSESIEILCSVNNDKMEDKELFRFYRNNTVIGDIYVRDFHSKMRDIKCDRGYCVSIGSFSESAHKYIDGRPIDFIEKEELVKILKKINMFG